MRGNMQFLHLLAALGALSFAAATCTKAHTVFTTITGGTRTTTSVYPVTTVRVYSSTVLVGTPYSGPHPFPYSHPPNPSHCGYYTGTDIPPPPSSSASLQARDPGPTRCHTTETTVTVEYLCVVTQLVFPPPIVVSKKGILTTKVPEFCASPQKKSTGEVPTGDLIKDLGYPYFAQTAVECCVYCSEQYYNLVASGFIPSGLDCECLVNKGNNYPGTSKVCPRGIQPYAFGSRKGQALPGPCRKEP